jgi:cardiolipin synthase A/B
VLPDDGLDAVLRALRNAKKSVHVTIFRCDLRPIEKALADAVERGVAVHALIANTNRTGERKLRELEQRLLGAGVTVSRTADDLERYHDKLLIVDDRTLFVFGFNFTRQEAHRRRSMGVVTRKRRVVSEALRLFEADAARMPFESSVPDLVISPQNARARLAKLLAAARRSLRIYDPQAIDAPLLRILKQRAHAGVDVRLLGRVGRAGHGLRAELPELRPHLRAILRDDVELFIGSQGLRGIELDRRREVGILVRDRAVISRFTHVFDQDWAGTSVVKQAREKAREQAA